MTVLRKSKECMVSLNLQVTQCRGGIPITYTTISTSAMMDTLYPMQHTGACYWRRCSTGKHGGAYPAVLRHGATPHISTCEHSLLLLVMSTGLCSLQPIRPCSDLHR